MCNCQYDGQPQPVVRLTQSLRSGANTLFLLYLAYFVDKAEFQVNVIRHLTPPPPEDQALQKPESKLPKDASTQVTAFLAYWILG